MRLLAFRTRKVVAATCDALLTISDAHPATYDVLLTTSNVLLTTCDVLFCFKTVGCDVLLARKPVLSP